MADPKFHESVLVFVRAFSGGHFNEGTALFEDPFTHQGYVRKYVESAAVADGRFKNEVRILQQLQGHPNINSFVHARIDRRTGRGVLWLKYCNAGTLQDVIENYRKAGHTRLPSPFVLHVIYELAAALAWIRYGIDVVGEATRTDTRCDHWNGIVHRDIKPDNIFLKHQLGKTFPRVVLGDFGCGAWISDRIDSGSPLNPERFPTDHNSNRGDIYGVGLTAAEMVGGYYGEEPGRLAIPLESCGCSLRLVKLIYTLLDHCSHSQPDVVSLYQTVGARLTGLMESVQPLPEWSLSSSS